MTTKKERREIAEQETFLGARRKRLDEQIHRLEVELEAEPRGKWPDPMRRGVRKVLMIIAQAGASSEDVANSLNNLPKLGGVIVITPGSDHTVLVTVMDRVVEVGLRIKDSERLPEEKGL